jgi:hypothetical protein
MYLLVYILNQNVWEFLRRNFAVPRRQRNTVFRYHRHPLLVICFTAWDSPSHEANIHSASQKVPLFWNHDNHYRAHNSLTMVPIPSQLNPLHTLMLEEDIDWIQLATCSYQWKGLADMVMTLRFHNGERVEISSLPAKRLPASPEGLSHIFWRL